MPLKSSTLQIFLCVAFAFFTMCSAAQGQDWQPSKVLSKKLGPVKELNEFSIRLPANLALKRADKTHQASGNIYFFGKAGSTKRFGGITVSVIDQPLNETPDEAVTSFVDNEIPRYLIDIDHSDDETGSINGVSFARIYYKGTMKHDGKKVHGMVYIGVSDNRAYIVKSEDVEPDNGKSLPLTEAAILTFHEKPVH